MWLMQSCKDNPRRIFLTLTNRRMLRSAVSLGRLGTMLAMVATTLLLVPAQAQFRTEEELRAQSTCMVLPKQSPSVTYTPVGGFPANENGAPIFQGKQSSTNLRILCADVFYDHSATVNATQAAACLRYGYTIHICMTTVSTGVIACNVTANELLLQSGNTFATRDFSAPTPFTVSMRWVPNASMPSACFPLYFSTVVVEQDITPDSPSSIVAVVVFVIIAAVVLIVLGIFARYQIRKVLAKFEKKISAKPPRRSSTTAANDPPPTSIYDDPVQGDGIHIGYEGQEEMDEAAFRQQYGEHAIRSHGAQQAELVDGVVVSSRPFVQPWYERSTFVSPTNAKVQPGGEAPHYDNVGGSQHHGQQRAARGGRRGAPVAMQVAHIVPPSEGGSALRRRQPSPYQEDGPPKEAPLFMDAVEQSFNGAYVNHRDGDFGARSPPLAGNAAGPRRLQFPSPVHAHGGTSRGGGGVTPPLRTLNPYDEYDELND